MEHYSYESAIDELVNNLRVVYEPYGTWIIKSHFGRKETRYNVADHYSPLTYTSHNEEDSIGIFDGEKYYPQDFEEWKQDYAQYEIEDYEHYHEDELRELFNDWCEGLWSDSGNERLAKNLLNQVFESTTNITDEQGNIKCVYTGYDNILITRSNNIVVLDESDEQFIEESGLDYYNMLYLNDFNGYYRAKEAWEDAKEG